jgi:GAF domain-containing protein
MSPAELKTLESSAPDEGIPDLKLSQGDALAMVPNVDRNDVAAYKDKLYPNAKKLPTDYGFKELERLHILDRAKAREMNPKRIAQVLQDPEKLRSPMLALVPKLVEDVLASLERGDPVGFLRTIAAETERLIRCEFAVVYVRRPDGSADTVSSDDRQRTEAVSKALDAMTRRFEDWDAKGTSFTLYGQETESRFYSLAAAPVRRRDKVTHWLVALNKLGRKPEIDASSFFDALDKAWLELLAKLVAESDPTMSVSNYLRESGSLLQKRAPYEAVLKTALVCAVHGTAAARGSITYWNPAHERLQMIASMDDDGSVSTSVSDIAPHTPEFWAYEKNNCRKTPDTSIDPLWKQSEEYGSSLTVPLPVPGMPVAAGSLRLDFRDKNAFTDQDRYLTEELARQASLYAQSMVLRDSVRTIIKKADAKNQESGNKHLRSLMDGVLNDVLAMHFPYCLIYLANHNTATLEGYKRSPTIEEHFAERGDQESWDLNMEEPAIATKVFADNRAYFHEDSGKVLYLSPERRERFKISGAIVGIPIRFGRVQKGVMIVWSPGPPDGPPLLRKHIQRLQELITLQPVASYHRDRERQLSELDRLMKLSFTRPQEVTPQSFMKAICGMGLRRSRFLVLEDGKFRCMAADGEDAEVLVTIDPIDCPHVNEFQNRWESGKAPSEGLFGAEFIDPRLPGVPRDANAAVLLKDENLPWIQAPVFDRKGNLRGYIAADNKNAPATDWTSEITGAQIKSLSSVAACMSQLIEQLLAKQ